MAPEADARAFEEPFQLTDVQRVEVATECRTRSFLNPTGATANALPPKGIGPVMEILVFVTFILISAFKLIVVDASKSLDVETGRKVFPYQTSSILVVMSGLLIVGSFSLCWAVGGRKQLASVWQAKPLLIFSLNGVAYAVGDYLQMASMSSLHGAAFQILVQSRILITAGLLICVKGVNQTRLQWTLLFTLMMAVSIYMIVMSSSKDQSGDIPITGVMFVLLKVCVSCICNVVSDKYMKVYKDDPTHVQIARMSVARSVAVVLLSFTGDTWAIGLFSGWDSRTFGAEAGFFTKEVATYYIVALLDSNLRNIGESFSIPVIYAYDVLAPSSGKSFDIATVLAVLVVVATCVAYVDSKAPIEKAAKYDEAQARAQKAS